MTETHDDDGLSALLHTGHWTENSLRWVVALLVVVAAGATAFAVALTSAASRTGAGPTPAIGSVPSTGPVTPPSSTSSAVTPPPTWRYPVCTRQQLSISMQLYGGGMMRFEDVVFLRNVSRSECSLWGAPTLTESLGPGHAAVTSGTAPTWADPPPRPVEVDLPPSGLASFLLVWNTYQTGSCRTESGSPTEVPIVSYTMTFTGGEPLPMPLSPGAAAGYGSTTPCPAAAGLPGATSVSSGEATDGGTAGWIRTPSLSPLPTPGG